MSLCLVSLDFLRAKQEIRLERGHLSDHSPDPSPGSWGINAVWLPCCELSINKGLLACHQLHGGLQETERMGGGGEAAPIDGLSGSITHFAADAVK